MKKIISTIIIVLFILCIRSYVNAETIEWQGIWAQDSRATASWSSYEDADYYYVEVFVHSDDGNTLVGSMETGTDALRIDLQQEIHQVVGDSNYDSVKVSFIVKAVKEGTVILATSNKSSFIDYNLRLADALDTPIIDATLNQVTITPVDNADYYHV